MKFGQVESPCHMLWDVGKFLHYLGEEREAQRNSHLPEVCFSLLLPQETQPQGSCCVCPSSTAMGKRTWAPAPTTYLH